MHARTRTGRTTTVLGASALVLSVLALVPGAARAADGDAGQGGHSRPTPLRLSVVDAAEVPGLAASLAPGASCATGALLFDADGGPGTEVAPAAGVVVTVSDRDPDGDDLLARTQTADDGSWEVCFESTDDDGGGQEVVATYFFDNGIWAVRPSSGELYKIDGGEQSIPDPGTATFGEGVVGDPSAGAARAYQGVGDLYRWVRGADDSCLDTPGADPCRPLIVQWLPGTDGASSYDAGSDVVELRGTVDDPDEVVGLAAQSLMDAVYDDALPDVGCTAGVFEETTTGCAWVLGWADWVTARVYGDPEVGGVDLEDQGWSDGHPFGDTVPERVAGALLDLSDAAGEAPWDRYSESAGSGAEDEPSYVATYTGLPTTFSEFFESARSGVADQGYLPRAAVFGNTIDYDSRDPLVSEQPLTRPSLDQPPGLHRYSMSKATSYWGGLALRSGPAADYDISFFSDAAMTDELERTDIGIVDYVVVDGNRDTGDDYFAHAARFAGSGSYPIEWYDDSEVAPQGITTVAFGAQSVLQVRDVFLIPGEEEFVRVAPSEGLDVAVALHESRDDSASWVQRPSDAVAESAQSGVGRAESLRHQPEVRGWQGLVLLNEGGSGTATIFRDITAPTSRPVLERGAATTDVRTVRLGVGGRDLETGLMDMRVAVDGVLDDEPFQAYAASRTVTLPPGLGTKQVVVQLRNNAGMVSAPRTASIELVAGRPEAPTVAYGPPARPTEISVRVTPPAWDGGRAITAYHVRCDSPDGGATRFTVASTSPVTVTGLTPGKQYRCSAAAENVNGLSPASVPGPLVTTPGPTVPDAASITAVAAAAGAVSLTGAAYDGGSPITGWAAVCSSSDGGATRSASGATSSLRVVNLTGGKSYRCRMRASNAIGTGVYGPAVQALVPTGPPEQPQVTSTTASAGAVTVRFALANDGGAPVTSYVVSCASPDGGVPRTRTVTASPATVVDLTGGKRYRCRVRATNSAGSSSNGAAGATVAVPTGRPAPVTLTFTMLIGNNPRFDFAPNGNGGSPITSYTVQCTSSDGGATRSASGPASPITVRGLSVDKTYRCHVRATNAVGTGAYGAYADAFRVMAGPPEEPVVTSTTPSVGAATVRFRAPADGGSAITSYTVSCVSTNGGRAGAQSGTASPLRVTGLTTGKTYRCQVRATNAAGNGTNGDFGEPVRIR